MRGVAVGGQGCGVSDGTTVGMSLFLKSGRSTVRSCPWPPVRAMPVGLWPGTSLVSV